MVIIKVKFCTVFNLDRTYGRFFDHGGFVWKFESQHEIKKSAIDLIFFKYLIASKTELIFDQSGMRFCDNFSDTL
jgi:hypothetical protein